MAAEILLANDCCWTAHGVRRQHSRRRRQLTSDPPPTDSVSGTVTFKGAPLAGATITAFLTNSNVIHAVTTTDANGNYSFNGLPASGNVPADFQFWVSKPGYGFYPSVGSNAKVTRFDYTGQFVGNGVTDIAIYFTVIDYVALPNASLTGANFTAYDGSNALVTLARTGQTTSYVSGDDGSQLKGLAWPAARFTDNQDGTVTDHVTGLIWLKDGGCLPPALWTDVIAEVNQLANGACGLGDGAIAGKWRIPNRNELQSLSDRMETNHADFFNQTYTWKIGQTLYQLPIFSNFMVSEYYWTSTTNAADPTEAWTVYSCDFGVCDVSKANIGYTLAVR